MLLAYTPRPRANWPFHALSKTKHEDWTLSLLSNKPMSLSSNLNFGSVPTGTVKSYRTRTITNIEKPLVLYLPFLPFWGILAYIGWIPTYKPKSVFQTKIIKSDLWVMKLVIGMMALWWLSMTLREKWKNERKIGNSWLRILLLVFLSLPQSSFPVICCYGSCNWKEPPPLRTKLEQKRSPSTMIDLLFVRFVIFSSSFPSHLEIYSLGSPHSTTLVLGVHQPSQEKAKEEEFMETTAKARTKGN